MERCKNVDFTKFTSVQKCKFCEIRPRTYFDSPDGGARPGGCSATVCPCKVNGEKKLYYCIDSFLLFFTFSRIQSDVCQLRLDFDIFQVIEAQKDIHVYKHLLQFPLILRSSPDLRPPPFPPPRS